MHAPPADLPSPAADRDAEAHAVSPEHAAEVAQADRADPPPVAAPEPAAPEPAPEPAAPEPAGPEPAAPGPAAAEPAVADSAQTDPPATAEPTRVVVPRIGVDHPLVQVGLHPDRTLEVPDARWVAGWYTGAPRPGVTGPSVLVGHNAWGGPAVFYRLHTLVAGDVVEVHHDDGTVVRFAVERVEQHPKDDFPTQRVYGNTSRREVRIITCGGAFDPNRQGGSHVDNIVVFGVRTH